MTNPIPRVVGVDLSLTATGIARASTAEPGAPSFDVIKTNLKGMARLDHIEHEIAWVVGDADCHVDLVVLEGYAFGRPNQAAHLGELGGVIRHSLWAAGIPYVDVPPANVKKYATGRGNAPKPDIRMEVFKRFGHDIADDNACDAFVLYAMGLDALGHPLVAMPQTHRVALDKVSWPMVGERAA